MITNKDINTVGSGSTVPDILITSLIINANPSIKNLYEIGTWVGGFIILVNSLTNGIKFYGAESMEAFEAGGKNNRKPPINFENIIDLKTLTYYIKETSLREYNKDINLSMFNSNNTAIEQINEPIDFIHFDSILDGDTVYNMSKYLINNKLSDHGVFCVDDYLPHCGFRSLAISKLVVENKLYPFYFADKKIFFCKTQQQQINYVVSIMKYINTKEFKESFEQLMPVHQYFNPLKFNFNGISHPHFTFNQG